MISALNKQEKKIFHLKLIMIEFTKYSFAASSIKNKKNIKNQDIEQ